MKFLVLALAAAACGGNSSSAGPDGPLPHGDATRVDGMTGLDPNLCAGFAQNAADAQAQCGTPLPPGAQASLEAWCRKGVTVASLCGGSPANGLACFAHEDATDWVCRQGQTYPSCDGDSDAALGAFCLISSGNPQCASITCQFDVDCSGSARCNSVTKRCLGRTSYCVGLPCTFDVDCPDAEKCDSGAHACVVR
jgi:hypothetical protein